MKNCTAALLTVACCIAMPARAIDFWHSSTVWANHGMCSALFTFDSMDETKNLQVAVNAVNRSGKVVASGVLEVAEMGQSNANRYQNAFLAGEGVCGDDLTIIVKSATAIVNGKRVDLLRTKALTARDFKPFKIRIGN